MHSKPHLTLSLLTATLAALLAAAACSPSSEGGGKADSDAGNDTGLDADHDTADATPDTTADATRPPACPPSPGDASFEDHALGAGWTVAVAPETGAWQVRRGDRALLSSPGPCEGDAPRVRRGDPRVENLFGAFQIDLDATPEAAPDAAPDATPDATPWEAIDAPPHGIDATDDAVVLRWELDTGATLRLGFHLYDGKDLEIRLASSDPAHRTGEFGWSCGATDSFFGLGTQVVGMDLRGRTYPMWTQEQGNGKPEGGGRFPLHNVPEAAYAPMGVLFSSAGYAGLLGHDGYHELDLCHTHDDTVRLRAYPQLPSFVLVRGDTPRDQLEAVTAYTGRVGDTPDWVFGPWNDAVGGPERLWNVAHTLRDHGVPSSAIWSEDWIGGNLTATGFRLSYAWEWDPATYPDLPADIAELHRQGFAFLGYFNPFIPNTVPTFAEGRDGGFLIQNADGTPYTFLDPAFRTASLVDLSNPAAEAWLAGYLTRAITELGIDGWMADFAEWLPVDAVLHGDTDPWLFHNRYPLEWQRIHREAFEAAAPERGFTFFARSGWASVNGGSAGLAPTMWGGDQNTNWKYDDGLPTIVPIGAHAGLAGVAIYGSDIAGYNSLATTNTDKELFLRWSSIGAFHPLMRTHHGGDKCNNWMFDRDAETLDHYRRYARIHTLLLPLWRSLATDATTRGLPVVRHPYLVEPTTPRLWHGQDYQYFIGDDLLVAPVLEQGATTRRVTLPDGTWWPLFGHEPAPAAPEHVAQAPVTELPVFVRAGTILALLGEPVDSFYGASDPAITDLDDVAHRYRLALYPDPAGALATTTVGTATISGRGWTTHSLADATLDGAALPPCDPGIDTLTATTSCHAGDAVFLVGDALTLTTPDGARLDITSATPQTYRVALAAAGWAPLHLPTPVTDLHPETTANPCD